MSAVFLTAEWRKLILANYPVDPASLRSFIPLRTELDTWEGDAFVSLVGFQFRHVRVHGLLIPLHTHFPEVNLRFYVRLASPLDTDSHEEFITEHFWGYTRASGERTGEYQVAHPRWDIYPVLGYKVDCDFGGLYGPSFAGLEGQEPQSVYLAEGSPIQVYSKTNV